MIRAVIDANVWVSAFLKPESVPGQGLVAWQRREFEAHVASVTVVEVARVLARPKLDRGRGFVGDIVAGALVHDVHDAPARCRDRADDVLVELAIRLSPSLLVSGDADLVGDATLISSMATSGVTILTPAAFLRTLLSKSQDR